MNLKNFSQKNRERCESPSGFNHKLTDWSLSDWMTAIMGELGEAANVAKKLNRIRDGIPGNKESEEVLQEKLGCELADSFIYLDLFFQRLGLDLGTEVIKVFNAKSEQVGSSIKMEDLESDSQENPMEIDKLKKEGDDLRNALINAGRALCIRSNNSAGWWNDPLVARQVREIEKMTGHSFS